MRHAFRPALRPFVTALLLTLTCAATAAAQRTPVDGSMVAPGPAALAVPGIRPDANQLRQALALSDASLQRLALPAYAGAPFTVRANIAGMDSEIVLTPYSMRADDFQLLVQGADGVIAAQQPAPPVTYRGYVTGLPESFVTASLIDGQLQALVRIDGTRTIWGVQPATLADARAPRDLHVVYDSADVSVPGVSCGTPDAPAPPAESPADSSSAAGPGDVICEIACDADVEFYSKNGSNVTSTMNDIETVLNSVEAIYDNDVGILYTTTAILVRTAEPDPYSSTNSSTLLNQFQAEWNSNQAGVQRDIAHFFTGKNIAGSIIGIAQLSVICSQANGYGLVESKYTNNLASRTALSAHELGHNWSAQHCDGESSCSIMCSGLGGCSGNITSFNTSSKNAILAKKNASGCLEDAVPPLPPVLTSVSPTSVQALAGGTVTLTGTSLLKTTQITVGALSLVQGVDFSALSDTQLSFAAPTASALGAVNVVVTNISGSSSAKTLTYVETDPPKLVAFPFAVALGAYTWSWGGGVNDFAFLTVGFTPATYIYQGQTILATDFIVLSGPLNAIGLGSLTLTLPASAALITFYSQVVTLDGATVKSSEIASTLVGL